jgi:hypothetical protein
MFAHVKKLRGLTCGVLIAGGLMLVGFSGCGGGGGGKKEGASKPRVSASGKVEFDGNPIPAGTVSFMNLQTGNIAVCPIYNGSYSSKRGEGPNPGENTVNIVGRESEDGDPMWAGAWTKKVTVDESGYKGDFSISSDQVRPFDPSKVEIDD